MTFTIVVSLTVLLCLLSVMPFVPVPHGFFRVADFPRVQVVAALLVLIGGTGLLVEPVSWKLGLIVLQLAAAAGGIPIIARYTPLWPVQSHAFRGDVATADTISVLACNVKLSNRDYDRFLKMVDAQDPDLLVLVEVDQAWVDALAHLRARWAHGLEHPLDTGYGMLVRSKLPLTEARVLERLLPGVPSMTAALRMPSGRRIRVHAVHPEPPVPHVDTLGRDGEILLVGAEVAKERLPVLVTGDLNDVAWSHTTRRFQRLTGLLDPRVGRGFYNSFDARFPLIRWPLDHLFHSKEFEVVEVTRLPHIGSDHFPMFFRLALVGSDSQNDEHEPADASDHAEAREVVAQAAALDRDPIGEDWEG